MKPDATHHDPRPEYIRALVKRSGLTQAQAATRIGIDARTMRRYLAGDRIPPYPVQYALEQIAHQAK